MSHNKLLTVVEIACVQNSVALEWFRSYLVGCRQHVRTSNCSSSLAPDFIISAAAVTAPGRLRPYFTSFRRSRP